LWTANPEDGIALGWQCDHPVSGFSIWLCGSPTLRPMTQKNVARGAQGGASSEAGGEYRRALAALFISHALNGAEFKGLPFGGTDAVVRMVALETDAAVDDILVDFVGGRLYVQAKRRLTFGRPLNKVVDQWLRAVRDDFDPEREFVAVGSGSISRPLTVAAKALERRRSDSNASWTRNEREQVEKLEALLREKGASAEEAQLVLSRSVFLERQVEDEHEPDAENGQLLLDGHVVEKGEGGRAWRELVSGAGRAARNRLGHSVDGWLDVLRTCRVPLTADAERSVAAALERQRQAVIRYRERLSERGRMVDLTAVGAQLPPLPLEDLDAEVTVRDPEDREDRAKDLLWAFRRRGRVTLTGLPGGGKSTLLGSVAGRWAGHRDWSIPIAVSLRRLAERGHLRQQSLRDDLLDLAVEETVRGDRELVRDALDLALEDGDAVLFLDGLDEAADRSLTLTSEINDLLRNGAHADTDVLLATRDSAYSDAQILGFDDLTLNRPRDWGRSVRCVLTAIARQHNISDPVSWIEDRAAWIDHTLGRDSQLSETPLVPILLALLAGEDEVDSLPTTRGQILADVVTNVVERYEVDRELTLSAIPEGHEADALMGAFPRIASVLADEGAVPRASLVVSLVPYLTEEWHLARAPARRTAEEILRFWDESGVFVAYGRDRKTTPRVQLLVEIGVALDAATGRVGDPASFVADLAQHTERHETLILAAGLSQGVADALIAYATAHQNEELMLAAATALAQGGVVAAERLHQLVDELVELMQAGDDVAWREFRTLVLISMPKELQENVLTALESFDHEHRIVGRALAALEWDWNSEGRDEMLEAALRVEGLPRLSHRHRTEGVHAILHEAAVDQAFTRVTCEAAAVLLPRRPELANAAVAAMRHLSMSGVQKLTDVLEKNGHSDLAQEAFKDTWGAEKWQRFASRMADMADDVQRTLGTITALAPPAVLTRPQERRRDELASFLETLDLNHMNAWLRSGRTEAMRERWVRLVAALGGFDVDVLSAQAQLVLDETTDEDHAAFYSLFDGAQAVSLEHWESVTDKGDGLDLALELLSGGRALARVSARALATHPNRAVVATRVEDRLPVLGYQSKLPAVWVAVNLADDSDAAVDRQLTSGDAATRVALASIIDLHVDGQPTALGRTLAMDEERDVQLAALASLGEAPEPQPELNALIARIADSPSALFRCRHCGTRNEADSDSCTSCNIVTRRPSIVARELLAKIATDATETRS